MRMQTDMAIAPNVNGLPAQRLDIGKRRPAASGVTMKGEIPRGDITRDCTMRS